MGYYMGDFYARGGRSRYMGDPGFFSFLGGLAKKAVGFIPGVGPIARTAIDIAGSAASKFPKTTAVVRQAGQIVGKHPVLSAAGGASAIGAAAAAMHHRGSMAGAGIMSGGHAVHMGGRRHRRMNACNPKALRRAIRRTHSFAKLAMKTIHLVHPKKHVTFGGFKTKRRKK
jgi:hypothetical protein